MGELLEVCGPGIWETGTFHLSVSDAHPLGRCLLRIICSLTALCVSASRELLWQEREAQEWLHEYHKNA